MVTHCHGNLGPQGRRVGEGQLKACLSLLWLKSFWLTSKKGLNSLIFRGEGCHGKEEGQRKAWEVVGIS